MTRSRAWPGQPYPLGATWDGNGVNFALFSAHAEKVELCLFDADGEREIDRIALPEYTDEVWHGYLPDARPGSSTAIASTAPTIRATATASTRTSCCSTPTPGRSSARFLQTDAHLRLPGRRRRAKTSSFDRRDSARVMPKCRVVDGSLHLGRRPAAGHAWADSDHLRSARAGLHHAAPGAAAAAARHLRRPCSRAGHRPPAISSASPRSSCCRSRPVRRPHLVEHGLRNYWGYNTIGFFAPDPRYCRPACPPSSRPWCGGCTRPASR